MRLIACCTLLLVAVTANADQYVNGYFRKDGTYVQPHYKSSPNANRYDNYSSRSMGGNQRDEFSSPSATNRSNPGWTYRDNDGDGLINSYDPKPDSRCNYGHC